MAQVFASLTALLLGIAILVMGSSLLGLVLPLKMIDAGFSTETTGLVMAANFVGLLLGSLYGKRLIVQVGHIRAFAGLAAISSAAALAYVLAFSELSWFVLRIVVGFCTAGLFATLESWLNARASNETRGRMLSVYLIVNYTATVLGQLMINVTETEGVKAFIVASLLVSLSIVPVVLTRAEAPDLRDIRPLSLHALYAASPLSVIGSFVSGMLMGAYWGLGAVFAQGVGFDLFETSMFMGAVVFGALVLQWPIGRLSDRYDRRKILLLMLLLTIAVSAGGIIVSVLPDRFWWLLGLGALLGGAISCIYPIATAQAFDYLSRDQYIAATSGLLLAYAVGATAGPIACGFMMGQIVPHAFFAYMATVSAAFAVFVVHRLRRREPVPAEAREKVVATTESSPVVAELDPRAAGSQELEPGGKPERKAAE